jgi:hypothetical protein
MRVAFAGALAMSTISYRQHGSPRGRFASAMDDEEALTGGSSGFVKVFVDAP